MVPPLYSVAQEEHCACAELVVSPSRQSTVKNADNFQCDMSSLPYAAALKFARSTRHRPQQMSGSAFSCARNDTFFRDCLLLGLIGGRAGLAILAGQTPDALRTPATPSWLIR